MVGNPSYIHHMAYTCIIYTLTLQALGTHTRNNEIKYEVENLQVFSTKQIFPPGFVVYLCVGRGGLIRTRRENATFVTSSDPNHQIKGSIVVEHNIKLQMCVCFQQSNVCPSQ